MQVFLLALLVAGALAGQSPAIRNFGEVEPGILYRGAQPDGRGLLDLKGYGIRTVIDLRTGNRTAEQAAVSSLGMLYRNVPLNGVAPSRAGIQTAVDIIQDSEEPVFVHCQHGQDRTGTVVAAYRMERDGWLHDRAFAEAVFFHINPLQILMRHFIKTWAP